MNLSYTTDKNKSIMNFSYARSWDKVLIEQLNLMTDEINREVQND